MAGKYRTVVIDFPWPIAGLRTGAPTMKHDRRPIYRSAAPPADYELMSEEQILRFPIDDFAAQDALLFIWVTNGKTEHGAAIIRLALDCLDLWGFEYHTLITWYKHQGLAAHSPIRTASEHVVFGWRGHFSELTPTFCRMNSVIETDHQIRAAEKPAKFYQALRTWTPEPRIDLFARRVHPGFDGWGNEYAGNTGPLLQYLDP